MKIKIFLLFIIVSGALLRLRIGMNYPYYLIDDSGRDILIAQHILNGESLFITPYSNFSSNLPNSPLYYWIVTIMSLSKNYENLALACLVLGIYQIMLIAKIVGFFKSTLATIFATFLLSFSVFFIHSSVMVSQPRLAILFFLINLIFFIRSIQRNNKSHYLFSIFILIPLLLTHYSFLILLPTMYIAYLFCAKYITSKSTIFLQVSVSMCFLISLITVYIFTFTLSNVSLKALLDEKKQTFVIPSLETAVNSFKYPYKAFLYVTTNTFDNYFIVLHILLIVSCFYLCFSSKERFDKAMSGICCILLLHPVTLSFIPKLSPFPQYFYLSCIVIILSTSYILSKAKSKIVFVSYIVISIYFISNQIESLKNYSQPSYGLHSAISVTNHIAENLQNTHQKHAQVLVLRWDFSGSYMIDEWFSGGIYSLLEKKFGYPFIKTVPVGISANNFVVLSQNNQFIICVLSSQVACDTQLQAFHFKTRTLFLTKVQLPSDKPIWIYKVN